MSTLSGSVPSDVSMVDGRLFSAETMSKPRLNVLASLSDEHERPMRRSSLTQVVQRISLLPSNSHFSGAFRLFSNLPSKQAVENFPYPKPRLLSKLYPVNSEEIEIVGRAVAGNQRYSKRHCGGVEVANFIQFDFSGVSLRTSFRGTRAFLSMDGAGAYFNVFIDGALVEIIESHESFGVPFIYELCPPQQWGTHTVVVSKRTEACVKTAIEWFEPCTIYGIFVEGGGGIVGELLPMERSETKPMIEFVGDSDTTAFGNEGPPTSCIDVTSMNPAKQNAWNSYAAQTARAFNADYSMICWTAIGATNAPPIPGTDSMLQRKGQRALYPRTIANDKNSAKWNGPAADIVVIFLGGNDLTGIASECGDIDTLEEYCDQLESAVVDRFIRCQREVIAQVRARNPGKPIFVLSPNNCMMSAEMDRLAQAKTATIVRVGCRKAVDAYKREAQDENVHYRILTPSPGFSDPSLSDPESQKEWASLAHWSVYGHQRVAESLVQHIEETLPGWKRKSEPSPCLECLETEPQHHCLSFTVVASLFYYVSCWALTEAVVGLVLIIAGLNGYLGASKSGDVDKDAPLFAGYNIMQAIGLTLLIYGASTALSLSYEYKNTVSLRYMYYWDPQYQSCFRGLYFATIILVAPLVVMGIVVKVACECCIDCAVCCVSGSDDDERESSEEQTENTIPVVFAADTSTR